MRTLRGPILGCLLLLGACDQDAAGPASGQPVTVTKPAVDSKPPPDVLGDGAGACQPGSAGFVPAAGCTCSPQWTYAGKTYCGGVCGLPDGDANGPWCFTTSACNGAAWSYCHFSSAAVTCEPGYPGFAPPAGCTCAQQWTYAGKTYCGGVCGLPDGNANGPWCATSGACNGAAWTYCALPQPSGGAETPEGCEPAPPATPTYRPPAGCSCKQQWSYSGKTYCHGECAAPDGDLNGPWCFTESTCAGQSWAYCSASPMTQR